MTTTAPSFQVLKGEALDALHSAHDDAGIEAWRVEWLGRQDGRVTAILRSVKDQPPETRAAFGAGANELKVALETALEQKREALRKAALESLATAEALDVTLPGRKRPVGRLHPVTQTMRDCLAAFAEMGFRAVEGPEVEWAYYNFDAARIPEDHPARDMWDTIWVDTFIDGQRKMLLRTHTTPNQIRVMERSQPPIRVVVPGKCFRQEATDATHEWMLTQIEGLAVDEGVRMSDLKGTLYGFARRLFGDDRRIIFHHSYFPFVEPGVEMAIDCFICRGAGADCRTCHGTGWIEILGAGMVHPEIIEKAGYDSSRYTGFAFGMGVERVALLRWGIEDIRHFYQNDLRFLSQF
ncbi:MAG: phenylalanine--tRNA ligase subunit alpha [Dehalococcoidia bacterium]|nr:phenylalanine--tRNA ligase subunit alpha [Chloroflexi bacterium CFX7]MCK6564505.1 phenylalanine--tRNA ligase subunit alpha [Dehalococcoidia bacterium]NUQ56121.1 phenylalanine--tRNA ligase subunit alpha [Dehalococcoidia bacterium]RIL01757.1 MAG: phenylalanine--tRNA ligase subunit alpha [bacterium]